VRTRTLVVLCLALLCACAAPSRQPLLVESPPGRELAARVAATAAKNPEALDHAIAQSLSYVRTRPPEGAPFSTAGPACTWAMLAASLEHLRGHPAPAAH